MDARQQATPPDVAAARSFVVDFYAWYHPNDSTSRNIGEALSQRRAAFTTELAALIDADRACTAQGKGICSLDFDPVLNSQDPCERYEVGGAAPEGGTIGVPVYAVCGGRKDSIPSVIAILAFDSTGYRIANIIYDGGTSNLRGLLTPSRAAP